MTSKQLSSILHAIRLMYESPESDDLSDALKNIEQKCAELEAENAELKTALMRDSRPQADLHEGCRHYIAQCEAHNKHLMDLLQKKEPPPKMFIPAAKPLQWSKSLGIWTAYGASFDYSYGDDKPRLFIRDLRDNRTPNTPYSSFAELRAAAEAHHRETVLSLLNI